jgi:hypothetical protein
VTRNNEQASGDPFPQLSQIARDRAAAAVREVVAEAPEKSYRPSRPWPRSRDFRRDGPEPLHQLEAAFQIERAAHHLASQYIRQARQAGRAWIEIGDVLQLLSSAAANKVSVGEEAYDYALRDQHGPGRQTYTWTCPDCQHDITDHGPYPEPPIREEGHGTGCSRRVERPGTAPAASSSRDGSRPQATDAGPDRRRPDDGSEQ